jgi:hypothetical protein
VLVCNAYLSWFNDFIVDHLNPNPFAKCPPLGGGAGGGKQKVLSKDKSSPICKVSSSWRRCRRRQTESPFKRQILTHLQSVLLLEEAQEEEEENLISKDNSPLCSFATRTYHGLTILSFVCQDYHHSHRFKPVAIEKHQQSS